MMQMNRRGFFAALLGAFWLSRFVRPWALPDKRLAIERFCDSYIPPVAKAIAERIDADLEEWAQVNIVTHYDLRDPNCPIVLVDLPEVMPWENRRRSSISSAHRSSSAS